MKKKLGNRRPMTASEAAHAYVKEQAHTLMRQGVPELRGLIAAPRRAVVVRQKRRFEVTHWAEDDPGRAALAVIVEARTRPVSWLAWDQVTAFGFYATADGSTVEFEEKDYYAHGY